jgi:hypothetical protein
MWELQVFVLRPFHGRTDLSNGGANAVEVGAWGYSAESRKVTAGAWSARTGRTGRAGTEVYRTVRLSAREASAAGMKKAGLAARRVS